MTGSKEVAKGEQRKEENKRDYLYINQQYFVKVLFDTIPYVERHIKSIREDRKARYIYIYIHILRQTALSFSEIHPD